MDRYLSTFINKVDAKGRISVPAPFRAILLKEGHEGVFCRPDMTHPVLEAGGDLLIGRFDAMVEACRLGSPERREMELVHFGGSDFIRFDRDGRILLTEALRAHAQIADRAAFVGMGERFEIWNPPFLEASLAAARRRLGDAAAAAGGSS